MGDNGDIKGIDKSKPEKTQEQLAQERLERYQKDPTSFTEITDIVASVIKKNGELCYLLGNNPIDLERAWAMLNRYIPGKLNYIERKVAEIQKTKLHIPHGIMNFVRRSK